MANGEFDGLSVDNLRAMLAGADADKLTAAGTALGDAGPKILDIGSDLRHHVSRVEWTGEGGSAFREWAHDFALEVMRFGQFTTTVGKHVAQAGQTLSETKSALPASRDPRAAHEDPAAQKAASQEAEEARHQLERLSSAYRAAQQTMEAEREPQFKVLPGVDGIDGAPAQGTATGGANTGDGGHSPLRASSPTGGGSADVAQRPEPAPADRESTRTGIDSVTTDPKREVNTLGERGTPVADPPKRTSPEVVPTTPGVPAPSTSPPSPRGGGRGLDRPPRMGRSGGGAQEIPARPVSPRSSTGGDLISGQPRSTGNPSRTRLPRGMVVGEDHSPMSRGPMTGSTPLSPGVGGSVEERPAGRRLVSEAGGQVSGPRMPAANSGVNPRGAAIGEQRGVTGRGPLPGALRPIRSESADGASGETAAGRRLASEPGGSVADPHTSSRRRPAFTRGGTGLVRSGDDLAPTDLESGASHLNRRRNEDEPGDASGEDGSWTLGRRDTMPPVLE